jgi:hypothetical protein
MKISIWIAALVCLSFSSVSICANELTKIERRITKGPATASTPKYCLLVFGPHMNTRVWLVLDGDILYVDRNANGDLTEDGERFAANKGDGEFAEGGNRWFEVGEIHDGQFTHKQLRVTVWKLEYLAEREEQVKEHLAADPQTWGYGLAVDVEMPGWKGAGIGGRVEQSVSFADANGWLKFADKPEHAPIIHFGGPWQVTLYGRHDRLTVGRTSEVVLGVGTPGLGTGTTAYVGYEGIIPEKVFPTLEITYPPAREGGQPVKELYELKERC